MAFFRESELEDAGYPCRDLFPQYRGRQDQQDQRRYVEEVLVKLAEAGDLCITELMNQDLAADTAGQVILGHQYDQDAGGLREGAPVPPVLREYKVRVRSIEHEFAAQEPGKKSTFAMRKVDIRWQDGIRWAGYKTKGRARIPAAEDNIIDTRSQDKELLLQDAWRCLRQAGKLCLHRNGQRLQNKHWRYEEVLKGTAQEKKAGKSNS